MLFQHSSIKVINITNNPTKTFNYLKFLRNSLKHDIFIHDNANNMEQLLEEDSIDLSIIKPPYHKIEDAPSEHVKFIKTIIQKITTSTKIGGICCLIISEDMTKDGMDATEIKSLVAVMDDPNISNKWVFPEKILWVKSMEKATKSEFSVEGMETVSFDVTPFSSIWVMVKKDNDKNYKELNIFDHIKKLKISETKKREMLNSIWFIPQSSEQGYKDYLPKELILRLLMIFSKENDLVLDPFSGNGITAVACKTLKRRFICIEKDIQRITLAQKRFREMNKP